jgi:hypothetical protein
VLRAGAPRARRQLRRPEALLAQRYVETTSFSAHPNSPFGSRYHDSDYARYKFLIIGRSGISERRPMM